MDNTKKIRCAIYTRKSVDEGLAVEFNTLEAQREYCEAYVARQPGWVVLPEHYDDGGYSGGTMNRPAMKRLLKDIDAGNVDVVVAYKIDRLSRSLRDCLNLLMHLEEKGVSFVLVTQNVDTTTSMGRMQINLLMTFAQYEREMCSDRVRDKVVAMKKRGMWTGGPVPYGYTPNDRRLVIVPEEAEVIRFVFREYAKTPAPSLIAIALNRRGTPYKAGKQWNAKAVQTVLANRLYRGVVVFNGEEYPGTHPAIVTEDEWEAAHAATRKRLPYVRDAGSLEVGSFRRKLFCATCGKPLVVEAIKRHNTRYGYYVCRSKPDDPIDRDRCHATRIPAKHLDSLIFRACQERLADNTDFLAALAQKGKLVTPSKLTQTMKSGIPLHSLLDPAERMQLAQAIVEKVTVTPTQLTITFHPDILTNPDGSPATETLPLYTVKEANKRKVLLRSDNECTHSQDALTVLAAIRDAYQWLDLIKSNRLNSYIELAQHIGKDVKYITRRLKLALISPRITLAIMNQTAPYAVSLNTLYAVSDLPWQEQERRVLGA